VIGYEEEFSNIEHPRYTEYVKRIAFPLQQWLHGSASMLGNKYIALLFPAAAKS
jgi:hypothetical protein